MVIDTEKKEILDNFLNKLLENAEELDPEIAKVVNDHFWELVEV